jgi:tRNA A-37 threonylcarbamoyl transferase component Bud32
VEPDRESAPARPASAAFQPPSVEELATRFPQLEVLGFVGQGGMGAVYKARQKELDRLVAIKVLPPEVSRDQAFAERFTREAQALARLSHPNIVAVHDFGRTSDGLFYFIMEYVDGVNLRQAIQSGGMSLKEALAIVPQICDALQSAHDEGIVHRDIKPENILVGNRGRVKIADFGLAKLLRHTPGDVSLTGTQQVMGTVRYMAPEQMEGTKAVDHRADIYSLGVVFYELLTGELPVGRFAPPSKKVHVDVRLDEVVLRALDKEPEQRYQQAHEVKSAIERTSLVGAIPQGQPSTTRRTIAPSLPPRLMVTAMAGLMGGLTMAVGVALAVFAILTESPQSGQFWGWMGGAFGCIIGGGGALIGAINSCRQIAGAGELMTAIGCTWLDHILGGYAMLGGATIGAALVWSSLGSAARYSMLLLGAVMVGQSAPFWALRWRYRQPAPPANQSEE